MNTLEVDRDLSSKTCDYFSHEASDSLDNRSDRRDGSARPSKLVTVQNPQSPISRAYVNVGLCISCMQNPASVVFVHNGTVDYNGHSAFCQDCLLKYGQQRCPICRQNCSDVFFIQEIKAGSIEKHTEWLHVGVCILCYIEPEKLQKPCSCWVKQNCLEETVPNLCEEHARNSGYKIVGKVIQGGFTEDNANIGPAKQLFEDIGDEGQLAIQISYLERLDQIIHKLMSLEYKSSEVCKKITALFDEKERISQVLPSMGYT